MNQAAKMIILTVSIVTAYAIFAFVAFPAMTPKAVYGEGFMQGMAESLSSNEAAQKIEAKENQEMMEMVNKILADDKEKEAQEIEAKEIEAKEAKRRQGETLDQYTGRLMWQEEMVKLASCEDGRLSNTLTSYSLEECKGLMEKWKKFCADNQNQADWKNIGPCYTAKNGYNVIKSFFLNKQYNLQEMMAVLEEMNPDPKQPTKELALEVKNMNMENKPNNFSR